MSVGIPGIRAQAAKAAAAGLEPIWPILGSPIRHAVPESWATWIAARATKEAVLRFARGLSTRDKLFATKPWLSARKA
jgi:hypothetical protein